MTNAAPEIVGAVHGFLMESGEGEADWRHALLLAALDEAGDLIEALEVARQAVRLVGLPGEGEAVGQKAVKAWVTMGGAPCTEGEHCGGTPVKIGEGGKIEKGPKGTVGKKPSQLGGGKKPTPPKVAPSPFEKKPEAASQSRREIHFATELPPVLDTIDNHGLSITEMPKEAATTVGSAVAKMSSSLAPRFVEALNAVRFAAVRFSEHGKVSPDAAGIYLPGHGRDKDEPSSAFIGVDPSKLTVHAKDKPGRLYADPSPEGKVRHEIGHAFFALLQEAEGEWEFRQALMEVTAFGGGTWKPSLYAEENFNECYAEFFAMVTRPGFDRSSVPPEVRKVVDMALKG